MKQLRLGTRLPDDAVTLGESQEAFIETALKGIRTIVFNVHGVLTSGRIHLASFDNVQNGGIHLGGADEILVFSATDRPRVSVATKLGIRVALISGRRSSALTKRAEEMHANLFCKRKPDWTTLMPAELFGELGRGANRVLVVGDDWNDIPYMAAAGVSAAPASAREEVFGYTHFITAAKGGEGVASEVVERVLRAQDKWDEAVRIGMEMA